MPHDSETAHGDAPAYDVGPGTVQLVLRKPYRRLMRGPTSGLPLKLVV